MREVVLLYNTSVTDKKNKIRLTCVQMGIMIKNIEPAQYKVPIGFLAYGTEEQQNEYLIQEEAAETFDGPMMVLAGFTGSRMNQFLNKMRSNKAPVIGLKAMLTESNAVWDSLTLHGELSKEHEYMTKMNDEKEK